MSPRNLSSAALASMFAPSTSKVWLHLLEIDHEDLGSPIRVVDNNEDVTSNGNVFTACPFDIGLPADMGDTLPTVNIKIANPDRGFTEDLRSIASPPDITLWVVVADTPDTIEAGPIYLQLQQFTMDSIMISGEIGIEPILSEAYPGDTFSPASFPGLWP